MQPEVANPGDTITITGTNLSNLTQLLSVDGDINLSVVPSDTQLSFTLPLDAKSSYIYLKGADTESNPLYLIVKRNRNIKVSQELGLTASDIAFAIAGNEYTLDSNFETTIPLDNSVEYIHATTQLSDGNYSLLYSAVVLPDMDGLVNVDANSTAISWIFMGMGSTIATTGDNLRPLYDEVASNIKVQEFADYISTLQKNDFSKWSDRSDLTLKQKFQDALKDVVANYQTAKSIMPRLVDTLDTTNTLVTITQDPLNDNIYVNDIRYGTLSNELLNNGSVTIVNDTKLFLSVEARSKEDGQIVNGYEHISDILNMDQKTLIGPKGWGLLGISSASEIELKGEDSNLEIIIGSYGGTTDKNNLSDVLKARVFIDGIAAPALNMVLATLLDRTIPETHPYKNVIDAMSDIYGSGFLIQLTPQVSSQDANWAAVVDSLMGKPLTAGFDSCFQVPVGDNCEKVMIGLAKLIGVDAENAVNKLMLLTLEAVQQRVIKRSAVLLPVVGWIAEASFLIYDNIGYVSDSATIAESVYDMKQNPKEINAEIDFKLKISDVQPMCIAVTPAFSPVLLYIKGDGFLVDGANAPEIFIKNEALHDIAVSSIDMQSSTELHTTFDAATLVQDGSTLGSLFIGYDGFSVMYDKEITIVDERDATVYFDSITPESATYGATVTLKGCGWVPLDDIKVYFRSADGEVQAEVINKDIENIEVKVPDNAISGSVYVATGNKKTKNVYFELEPFGLTGADLESLGEDYSIVLEGRGLADITKVYFVDSAGVKKEGVIHTISLSDSSVIVDIPSGLQVGKVSIYAVRTDSTESNAIILPLLPKHVVATPDSQSFIDNIQITLTQEDNKDIYYTIDGGAEQFYSSPIRLTADNAQYNYFILNAYARVTVEGIAYDSKITTYNYTPCGADEALVDGVCLSSCNKVCANPTISNAISFPAHRGTFDITLTFAENFKWCTQERDDNSSLNDEITMLYFYKTDGSGTYSQPASSAYTFGQAALNVSYDSFNISMSPLPDYNSFTVKYYTPEDSFGMSVKNYDTLSEYNEYDFLWVYVDVTGEDVEDKERRTIINTEFIESNGCYEGNY